MQAYIAVTSEAMAKEVAACFMEGVRDLSHRFDPRAPDAAERLMTIENLTHASLLLLGHIRPSSGGDHETR